MRVLATLTGAFALGIFLAQYLLPVEWLLPCGAAAFVLAFARVFLRNDTGRRVLLLGVGLALAFGYDWLYIRQVQRPAEALGGTEREAVMMLCDYAAATDYGAKAAVRLDGMPGKAVYYGSAALMELEPGQTVTTVVHLESAGRIRDEDTTTFTSKGVFLLAYRRGTEGFGAGTSGAARWWPVRAGRALREKINVLFDGDTAAFLTAILTGDRSALSVEASAALGEAGLSHILAVSGMHCGFLLTLVMCLTGRHRRRLTALCALPLLIFYAALTGGSPSVLRACVMLMFLLAAPVFARDTDGPTAFAAALFCILLANPFAAASVSLQLSFAAMAGILFLTPRLYRLLPERLEDSPIARGMAAGASAAMGALVFTAPLSGWYFGTLTLIVPLSSLLCLWAASGAFLLGLLSVLCGVFCLPLARLLAVIPALLSRYILTVSGILAKIPYHGVYFENPYLKYWLAFAYLLFLAAWRSRRSSRRKYALAAVLVCLTLVLTLTLGQRRYGDDLEVKVLDVGQGQCVLLASGSSFTLVDCGSGNHWKDPGETAARHLRAMGCYHLERLILTHYDSDHISGVESLLARMGVERILVPDAEDDGIAELARSHGVPVETVEERRELPLGRAALTVLPPVGTGGDNERGLSVLACAGDGAILVTGDMDSATERLLLDAYDLPDLRALVAGHHGSKNATSQALLDALEPEIVCISVGSNRYGHPADETLRRLSEHGCAVYRTDMQGSIHLSWNRGDRDGIREKDQ